mmetsp:Transcript_4771/g.21592  ORF Transcript_4771/g.21592 Transcript_4771/m.21592 type:complete len:280 (-) Transcript_4771:1148-1987(-)
MRTSILEMGVGWRKGPKPSWHPPKATIPSSVCPATWRRRTDCHASSNTKPLSVWWIPMSRSIQVSVVRSRTLESYSSSIPSTPMPPCTSRKFRPIMQEPARCLPKGKYSGCAEHRRQRHWSTSSTHGSIVPISESGPSSYPPKMTISSPTASFGPPSSSSATYFLCFRTFVLSAGVLPTFLCSFHRMFWFHCNQFGANTRSSRAGRSAAMCNHRLLRISSISPTVFTGHPPASRKVKVHLSRSISRTAPSPKQCRFCMLSVVCPPMDIALGESLSRVRV